MNMSKFFPIMAVATAICCGAVHAREFSIPDYKVNPGGQVDVPVSLSDASGLGMVYFQVNFDDSILDLVSVIQGSLGLNFGDFDHDAEEGILRVTLVNETNLTSGQGPLVIMRFAMLNGADDTVGGSVSLASYDFTDTSGVVALAQESAATAVSGRVQASNDSNIDNFGNKLPDWWEDLYRLDKFSMLTASADPDGDGAGTLLEYALNGAPDRFDSNSLFGISRAGAATLLNLQLRSDDSALSYLLKTSEDLSAWDQYPITWNGSAWAIDASSGLNISSSVSEGDGVWSVQLEPQERAGSRRFYQTSVDR